MRVGDVALTVFALFASSLAPAYELKTHSDTTIEAFQRSALFRSPWIAKDLGIDLTNSNVWGDRYFEAAGGTVFERHADSFERDLITVDDLSVAGWLARGAVREDDLSLLGCGVSKLAAAADGRWPRQCNPRDAADNSLDRVLNHFYDPRLDRGLTAGVSGSKAVDWAIVGTDAGGLTKNNFSLFSARNYMYYALTGIDPFSQPSTLANRNSWWATTFRSLGDAMHLIQDMAQPQHTRNEKHPSGIFELYVEARALGLNTHKIDGTTIFHLPQLSFLSPRPTVSEVESRSQYSDFWSERQQPNYQARGGLADYSNRAFLTDGTNLGLEPTPYDSPSRDPLSYGKEFVDVGLGAPVKFLVSSEPETQILSGQTLRGARMSTESAFYDFGATIPIYSMNRFIYDDEVSLLLPRAAAYSAGLLDYFFRGRLDFLPDSSNPGKYVIRNLGAEPISGVFELYYDDANFVRKAVLGLDGLPVQWKTSAGPIAPNGGDLTIDFAIQAPSDPARPNEYVLVFHGQMGNEAPSPQTIGAVAAKIIHGPQGALYIGGADAGGRIMTIKVDARGARILNGYDSSGVFHFTPPGPDANDPTKDYDPLLGPLKAQTSNGSLPVARVARVRQAVISQGVYPRYDIVSSSISYSGGNPAVYVQDAGTGHIRYVGTNSDVTWQSVTSAGDQLTFVVDKDISTNQWRLKYTALLASGASTSGFAALPPHPGTGSTSYGADFRRGLYLLSPDGTKFSGFMVNGSNLVTEYELQISNTIPPFASFQRVRDTVLSETLTNDPPATACDSTGCTTSSLLVTRERTPPTPVEYVMSTLTYRSSEIVASQSIKDITGGFTGTVLSSVDGCPYDSTYEIHTSSSHSLTRHADQTRFLSDGAASDQVDVSNGYVDTRDFEQVTHFSSADGSGQRSTCWASIVDPPSQNSANHTDYPNVNSVVGTGIGQTISGRVDGTIMVNESGSTTTSTFRGQPIPVSSSLIVGDVAPTGEIFIADTSKAFVFYEPLKGSGMPDSLVLPPNMVRILGALWQ